MDTKKLAQIFKALSDPTRLKILEMLCRCCPTSSKSAATEGLTVGDVCCKITGDTKVSSTMSHHLKELRLAGLIKTTKQGKNILCCVDTKKLFAVLGSINSKFSLTEERKKL